MNGQNIGYIRVSTREQNEVRQLEGITLDRKFIDKASGKSKDRPQLKALLEHIREGDTVHIHSMDRLGRNLIDLKDIVEQITLKNVKVHFYKENLTFDRGKKDSFSLLIFNIMGSFAEFERELIKERQREGIQLARKEGKYKGRVKSLKDAQVQEIRQRIKGDPKINKTALAKEYNISRATLYKYLD